VCVCECVCVCVWECVCVCVCVVCVYVCVCVCVVCVVCVCVCVCVFVQLFWANFLQSSLQTPCTFSFVWFLLLDPQCDKWRWYFSADLLASACHCTIANVWLLASNISSIIDPQITVRVDVMLVLGQITNFRMRGVGRYLILLLPLR